MTPDRLGELLRETPIPQATQAREQAVAEARAAITGRGELARSPHPGRRRILSFAAAAALVVAALLTPPGRAASAWVGELVGIGDVGGEPTQEERGFGGTEQAVVIDNGHAPDGSRYEWVAYECKVDLSDEGLPTKFQGIGLSFEWPGAKGHEGSGSCEERRGAGAGAFSSHGVHIVPSQFKGVEKPDLVVSGSTGPQVHDVSVVYTDRTGKKHELPVDFARVEGKLRELARRSEPLGTFVAFVPGEWAARDEIESRLDLRALMGTGKLELGPLARRDRAAARRANEECESERPDPSTLPNPQNRKAVERAFRALGECLEEHMPPSPIEYVAYDERGHELERLSEPFVMAPPRAREAAGREQPGERRARRPTQSEAAGEPVVLLSGRAPEGALYEFYAERFERDGEVFGNCMTLWWPYVPDAGGGGSCGPGFPPSTAFGRRNPESVVAKPYGFLTDASPATRHRVLSGYARSSVSRVRVVYKTRQGSWKDAPVKLARVSGQLRERVRADEPFGFFVAFVPPSAGSRPPIEVIAFGEDGEEAGRYRHRE